jgi:electron transfer flavoprotein beta subunit
MKILVCISSVPDTTSKITFNDSKTEFNAAGITFVINPNDEFGLTKAIKLRDEHSGTVTVINVGEPANDAIIRKALAIGADDAIRINTKPTDAFLVATEIANHAKTGEYDLIICGRESIDYNGGQVPGMIGELLGIPSVSPCTGITINGTTATISRNADGSTHILEATLPVVLGGQKGLTEEKDLIIPNMRGIMTARSKPLTVVEPTGNEFKIKSVTFELPAPKVACKMASSAEELVQLLHNEAKVI